MERVFDVLMTYNCEHLLNFFLADAKVLQVDPSKRMKCVVQFLRYFALLLLSSLEERLERYYREWDIRHFEANNELVWVYPDVLVLRFRLNILEVAQEVKQDTLCLPFITSRHLPSNVPSELATTTVGSQ